MRSDICNTVSVSRLNMETKSVAHSFREWRSDLQHIYVSSALSLYCAFTCLKVISSFFSLVVARNLSVMLEVSHLRVSGFVEVREHWRSHGISSEHFQVLKCHGTFILCQKSWKSHRSFDVKLFSTLLLGNQSEIFDPPQKMFCPEAGLGFVYYIFDQPDGIFIVMESQTFVLEKTWKGHGTLWIKVCMNPGVSQMLRLYLTPVSCDVCTGWLGIWKLKMSDHWIVKVGHR